MEQLEKEQAKKGIIAAVEVPGYNQMVMANVDLPTNTSVRVIVLPKEDSHE